MFPKCHPKMTLWKLLNTAAGGARCVLLYVNKNNVYMFI